MGVWLRECVITIFEAISCSLAVIVSDLPAAAERVAWKNGLIYEEGDVKALSRAMKQLLMNEDLRKELRQRGREIVEEKFSWKVIAQRFLELVKNADSRDKRADRGDLRAAGGHK